VHTLETASGLFPPTDTSMLPGRLLIKLWLDELGVTRGRGVLIVESLIASYLFPFTAYTVYGQPPLSRLGIIRIK
jgi:hypothetical protein